MLGFQIVEQGGGTAEEVHRYYHVNYFDDLALRAKIFRRRQWLSWRGRGVMPVSRWHNA